MLIIYKTTCLINGKIYVGRDIKNNFKCLGSGPLLKKAIKEFGRKNFIRETLCECKDLIELNKMKDYWIEELNATDPKIGYNISYSSRLNFISYYKENDPERYKKIKEKVRNPKSEEIKEKMRIAAKNSKHNKSRSLSAYIENYGEIEGTEKYNEWNRKNKFYKTLNGYIEKYGETEGIKRNKIRIENNKLSHSLNGYIKKYGEIEGTKKWQSFCKKRETQNTKENFIKLYGEINGIKRFNDFKINSKFYKTLEGYIEKYGKIEGFIKWKKRWQTYGGSYSKISQILFFDIL